MWRFPVGLAVLAAIFAAQGERAVRANGPTFDEAAHFAAGYSYWHTGDFRLNVEDPPLAKLLWTLPQFLFDPLPFDPTPEEWDASAEWVIGNRVVFESGRGWESLILPARRINLLFGVGVVVLVGSWSRQLTGNPVAGLVSAACAALDPNLVAHSAILSTDAALTFTTLLTLFTAWRFLREPTPWRLNATGAALGLALGAKFSAVALVPALGLGLLAFAALGGSSFRSLLGPVVRVATLALIVVALLYFGWQLPAWGRGLKYQLVREQFNPASYYFDGEVRDHGWLLYFPAIIAWKMPLAISLLALGGLCVRLRNPDFFVGRLESSEPAAGMKSATEQRRYSLLHRGGFRRLHPPYEELALHKIDPATWFVVVTVSLFLVALVIARVNLGIRIILPMLPVVYLLAGRFVAGGGWRIGFGIVGIAWLVMVAYRASPCPLVYFNELAKHPEQKLGDSNLDWGQGLPALKEWLDREQPGTIYLSYCGSAPPEAFGIRYEPLPGYGRIGPPHVERVPDTAARVILAIGVGNLQGTYLNPPTMYQWLNERTPIARLAGCIWIYDLTGDAEALARVRALTQGNR